MTTRALVLRAPGINCDRETAHACRLVGFETDLVHINELLKQPERLLDYHFLVVPGGFSYGDDLGAGTLLARNLTIHLGEQVRRFVDEGRPVLGICNGFQVLVKAGLLPGVTITDDQRAVDDTGADIAQATLTINTSSGYECRWVYLAPQPGRCIFTQGIDEPIELPVGHGEGQFVLKGNVEHLIELGRAPLLYATNTGQTENVPYPANPNGSAGNVAGVCNQQGNVFGLMPHPDRFFSALQHPQRRGRNGDEGDGLLIFRNAYEYAQRFSQNGSAPIEEVSTTYATSGVDISAGEQTVRLMKSAVQATHGPEVIAGVGAFAGAFSATALQQMQKPTLLASTDGVGTKTLLAEQSGRYDTIGYDIVNHCLNDMLMQGGRPLFFMDYVAVHKLDPKVVATIVRGVAEACQEAGMTLLGGETAEMPSVYRSGTFDLAGTIVGVVEQDELVDGSTISVGDVVLGLPSNGLHTNGYSLARKVFASYPLDTVFPELGEPLIDALLRPHRSYLREIQQLQNTLSKGAIKGMAHLTGGSFEGNISRVLPEGLGAVIETRSWSVPPLFTLIGKLGNVSRGELYHSLNMGIGMVMVLSPKAAQEARNALSELLPIGYIEAGSGVKLV